MSCSYKPPMYAFAVQSGAFSHDLLASGTECVLAVPGERLAEEVLYCGSASGRETDKLQDCGLSIRPAYTLKRGGLLDRAKANLEVEIINRIRTGDHTTYIVQVRRFGVNPSNTERNLLTVGPEHSGFEVLAAKGIHRIGVIERGGGQGPAPRSIVSSSP